MTHVVEFLGVSSATNSLLLSDITMVVRSSLASEVSVPLMEATDRLEVMELLVFSWVGGRDMCGKYMKTVSCFKYILPRQYHFSITSLWNVITSLSK